MKNIRTAIEASVSRYINHQSRASMESLLLSGYFRIMHTEPLIENAIAKCLYPIDLEFWEEAKREESGHANVFWNDISARMSAYVHEDYVFDACPATVELLSWASRGLYELALYRAWLEVGICCAPEPSKQISRLLLPETMRIHEDADPVHAQKTLEYIDHFQRPMLLIMTDIARIESAMCAEKSHEGLHV